MHCNCAQEENCLSNPLCEFTWEYWSRVMSFQEIAGAYIHVITAPIEPVVVMLHNTKQTLARTTNEAGNYGTELYLIKNKTKI